MDEPRKEEYGPLGDPTRHRSGEELAAGFRDLPPAPKGTGRLALLVARQADGVRATPERVPLTSPDGVPGDRWARAQPDYPEAQIAVMRRDVAELIANGQSLTLFGDNFLVDLDISATNLPVGSRLRVGSTIVEVTPKPHNGCVKFRGRFGAGALQFVSDPKLRDQNLRGVYWRVVDPGEATPGDAIVVISRA
jgi:MOSC domain-containing protein YiiM